jgi:hypothetical protein
MSPVPCIRPTKARLQLASRISPGFDPSILQRSGIWGTADEAVLNNVHKKKKSKKFPLYKKARWKQKTVKNEIKNRMLGHLMKAVTEHMFICICKQKQTKSPPVEMVMVRPTLQYSNWAHTHGLDCLHNTNRHDFTWVHMVQFTYVYNLHFLV